MATIVDLRSITPRSNSKRKLSVIKQIARHHSATTSGDWKSFWKHWHDTKGWGTGGYHEIILRDGTVQLCYDPDEITNGVARHNTSTYHICLVGDGSFTDEQERAWEERALLNLNRFNLPVGKVLGHKEFAGASTACPGVDMGMIRNRLTYLLNKPINTPKTSLKQAIAIGSIHDYPSAERLAIHLKAPIYPKAAITGEIAQELFVVGGKVEGLKAVKIINLSGAKKEDTEANVKKYLEK